MNPELHKLAVLVVVDIAFVRFGWIVIGLARAVRNYRRAATTRWGVVELLNLPEPLVMAAVTYLLFSGYQPASAAGAMAVPAALAGAAFAIVGAVLSLWAFVSLPSVSTGHYVLKDQPIATRGPYGLVRHPIYLGVFLIWLALVLAFRSIPVLLTMALYVIPIYLLYMRAEERMMEQSYGRVYQEYCRRVGMLIPHLRRA